MVRFAILLLLPLCFLGGCQRSLPWQQEKAVATSAGVSSATPFEEDLYASFQDLQKKYGPGTPVYVEGEEEPEQLSYDDLSIFNLPCHTTFFFDQDQKVFQMVFRLATTQRQEVYQLAKERLGSPRRVTEGGEEIPFQASWIMGQMEYTLLDDGTYLSFTLTPFIISS